MKTLIVAVALIGLCVGAFAEDDIPRIQKFQLWGTLATNVDKLNLFIGFTNGLYASGITAGEQRDVDPKRKASNECILFSKELGTDQAIAMIDKYYKDHPEKWGDPIGFAFSDALTVSGGPCDPAKAKAK